MLNANSHKFTWPRCTYHFGKCQPLLNIRKFCLPLLTKTHNAMHIVSTAVDFSWAATPGVGCRAHFIKSTQCRLVLAMGIELGRTAAHCMLPLFHGAFPWRWNSKSHVARELCAGEGHAGLLFVGVIFCHPWEFPKRPAAPGCRCGR